jgi:hypothetical protein
MATASQLLDCIRAIDNTTAAFLAARSGTVALGRYEADLAAFKLMEVVYRHVNAVTAVAAMPQPGMHLVSAQVLLRAAFETALTAFWLTKEEDWKEREARWLGWVSADEDHLRKLARHLSPVNPEGASIFEERAKAQADRREAITRLLPKDSRERRPAIPQMLAELGIDAKYYIAYRVGSHIAHAGPSTAESVCRMEPDAIRFDLLDYSSWVDPLRMASWCITEPGLFVLHRAGVTEDAVKPLLNAHHEVLRVTEQLRT